MSKRKASNVGTLGQADVRRVYSAWKIDEITAKHSLRFKYDDGECEITHLNGNYHVELVGEAGDDFEMLITGVQSLQRKTAILEPTDAMEFLYKYCKMSFRILRDLKRSPIAEGELVASNFEPLDLDSLPIEERALAELLQEHHDTAERAGTLGEEDRLTEEELDAKIEEIKRRQQTG